MLYIASMLYVTSLHNHAIVASDMYHIVFIRTEHIVVDEIGSVTNQLEYTRFRQDSYLS